MPETITRPSADVAVRLLRDRLTVVAAAVEQLPECPVRKTLTCCRGIYTDAIERLAGGRVEVQEYAAAAHISLHAAITLNQECCSIALADVLTALGGWSHG